MTADWRSDEPEQPIKAWIRGRNDLDSRRDCIYICDSDLWVQRYGHRRTRLPGIDRRVQYVMLVEIKSHGREMDAGQRDLLAMVNDLLRTKGWKDQRIGGAFVAGHAQNARKVWSYIADEWVQIHCFGVHKLRLSGATPDDSDLLTWDRRQITVEQLVGLLRFDLSPDTLRPMEDRVHKRQSSAPTLFDPEVS